MPDSPYQAGADCPPQGRRDARPENRVHRGDTAGQSGEARIFLIQDDNLTAEVPLRRSILQSTLRQKYRSTGRHNPQRDGGPEKGLYRLHPIALATERGRAGLDANRRDLAKLIWKFNSPKWDFDLEFLVRPHGVFIGGYLSAP